MPDLGTKRCPVHRTSRMLAVLAHELRAPLGAIAHTTARLGAHAAAPDVKDACDLIHRQVRQISALLNDVIDGWRIADGRPDADGPAATLPLDLRDVVRDGADTVATLVEARSHTLRLTLPERPVMVNGNRLKLVQVVINLMTNAAKFTPSPGAIDVMLAHEGRHAVLRVRDTGPGIPASMRERIFRPFVRLDPGAADVPSGLGLGLALVRKTVATHRGVVTVRSEGPGRGSEFVVRLPLVGRPPIVRRS